MKIKEKVPSKMTILNEHRYNEFLQLIKDNRRLAELGLRTKAISPNREILVVTDKWKVIIYQEFKLTKNNKFYIRENKYSQIIFGKNFLYTKDRGQLRRITPFKGLIVDKKLITLEGIYKWYKLDFLFPYHSYMENETLTFLKKHKITNFEQYFKIKYKHIPYNYFKTEMHKKVSRYDIKELNNFLGITTNPNVIINYKYSDIRKKLNNNIYNDLINMSEQIKRKINLLWSDKRIKEEHNKLTKEIFEIKKHFVVNKKLSVNNFFKDILPKEYELIDTSIRLLQEGEEMKHCVFSSANYLDNIEKGNCAIYSIVYNGERFTLEIKIKEPWIYEKNKLKTNGVYINQFMGFNNKKNAPKELYNKTISYLKKIKPSNIPVYNKSIILDELPF